MTYDTELRQMEQRMQVFLSELGRHAQQIRQALDKKSRGLGNPSEWEPTENPEKQENHLEANKATTQENRLAELEHNEREQNWNIMQQE